jgi:nicotinamidase/pyrazinamidase
MPRFDLVVFTRDAHPPNHASFQSQGGAWPRHCVAGTRGFEFPARLKPTASALIIDKGAVADREAYSGFEGTDLANRLRGAAIRRVVIAGLATDYCVKATALDAIAEGFDVWLAVDAIAGVNVRPGDAERAVLDLRAAGVMLTDSGQLGEILRHHPRPRSALVVVDLQNDFLPGGALAVPDGDRILPAVETLLGYSASD